MPYMTTSHRPAPASALRPPRLAALALSALLGAGVAACAPSSAPSGGPSPTAGAVRLQPSPPSPDPRVGLAAGLLDAGEAMWNLRVVSATPPPQAFLGSTNSDLAFTGNYVIQGNYRGFQIWDVSNPASPALVTGFVCPASQSDVSVFGNLLFVSGEGLEGRLDCGEQGVAQAVSAERIRGVRIFDISDIRNPRYVGNVQTCRGSHTHTVVEHPGDPANVYIYVSGSAPVRPADELPGCSDAVPAEDPNSALFRIEVIRVPLANPEQAAIVASPRIFEGLTAPPQHGATPEERAEIERARAQGLFVVEIPVVGEVVVVPPQAATMMLDSIVQARGGSGAPTAADSAALQTGLEAMFAEMLAEAGIDVTSGPSQCHDITVYPAIGLAGGACEGYGLLLDITDPVRPRRLDAAADSNFAYWHSATFNNAGTAVLFTDEWGGGGGAKCLATDPEEWGANALFTIEDGRLRFQSYYKLPAVQTEQENCVAHNGSLIPIPGRDVMVQAWYQGGVSIFDWTDPTNPVEIAFHDRGPVHPQQMVMGGSWSVYWYNGLIVSSEIARGLDIFELVASPYISQNEIDAAKSVRLDEFNPQAQPRFVWPATFSLAGAYVDQLERSRGLSAARIGAVRRDLAAAQAATGVERSDALGRLATQIEGDAGGSSDGRKVRALAEAVRALAATEER